VSEHTLLDAIDIVGNQARAVEHHLRLGKPRERRRAPRRRVSPALSRCDSSVGPYQRERRRSILNPSALRRERA
jgi:hypothetical protein